MAEPDTCLIDGFGPVPVVRPESPESLGDLVRQAAADGQALYPLGGRTMLDHGLPPARPGLGVDLRALDQVIDYPARDMTITVRAGIPVARLQDLLAAENQRLPVDVPRAAEATLGGALAVNVSGPRRYGFGTFRDYVIGISVVNDEGQEVKAGGRVVKNVAGYDLCKLYIGSLGTLGIISQVTLKLKPRPEEQALLALPCDAEAIGPLLDRLHASSTRPVCVDLLNEAAARALNARAPGPAAGEAAVLGGVRLRGRGRLPEAPWVVVVGYEENAAAVAWQVRQLVGELGSGHGGGLDAWAGRTANWLWDALIDFPARPGAPLTFKANLLPRATAEFCRQAAALPEPVLLHAHAGSGIVVGHVEGALTVERAQAMLNSVQTWAEAARGNVIVLRCPPAWKAALPVWGRPRGDLPLMRRVKEQLDPRRLFNPGRFAVG
jgi:glycolate oxidase FAD binding subunit